MKKNYLYLVAIAMLAAACSNENDTIQNGSKPAPEVNMITETITASNGDNSSATRADIDNTSAAAFTWSTDDHIAIHVNGKYYTTEDLIDENLSDGNAEASFTVSYPEGGIRNAFAVFPASIVAADATNYGYSGTALDVTLPSSYTLAQVSGTTTPCPMIATNTPGGTLEFKQLCGLLRLTVNGIPASTDYLTIDFNGKKVQGAFSIASPVTPGTSVIATSPAEGTDDIITITALGISAWTDGMVLNLPLPTGDYTDITVTAYNSSDKAIISVTSPFKDGEAYAALRAFGRKVTASMPSPISVSATKKVFFAPGNLQYLGNADGTGTWRFAEHQYDFMGDGPAETATYRGNVTVDGYTKYNTSADKDVARDLFCWGTSGYNGYNPWMTSKTTNDYYSGDLAGTDYDWGVYHSASGNSSEKIINGGDYSWRLFTSVEWAYAIARTGRVYTRTDVPTYMETKNLYTSAIVMGVKGIILFPDNWDGSLDKTIKYKTTGYAGTTCDAEKWATFEKQGCVFLPAANVRSGVELTYANQGKYWSSTILKYSNEWRGGSLDFSNTGNVSTSSDNKTVRRLGLSVRLIREAE